MTDNLIVGAVRLGRGASSYKAAYEKRCDWDVAEIARLRAKIVAARSALSRCAEIAAQGEPFRQNAARIIAEAARAMAEIDKHGQ